ncbi:hypothetical protein WJX84_006794 [Apatococcus fuscideae]|uniref:Eukaryotic translation initiation factor 3 subunit F n=1 Tax=Apatococcus fuscideae TaxID=2026836 RepID=A0AAW1SCP1_9CHLO
MAPFILPVGSAATTVRVQPVVLFNVCDAYVRRNEGQERVIGTLLGVISDGVIDVRNCYAVPHDESSERVAVDITHHQLLAGLQAKVNPKEVVVGWYSTGDGVSGSDALIQDFYSRECQNPVHVTIDTTLQNQSLAIKAYISRALLLAEKQLATEFVQVDCEVKTADLGSLGVDLMEKEISEKVQHDADSLETCISQLSLCLEQASEYVDKVVEGKQKPDQAIGRSLAEAVSQVPFISKTDLEQLTNDSAQDVLLIMYLSNLVRTQLALADRLGTAALPLL